jgi:hypothetical protein
MGESRTANYHPNPKGVQVSAKPIEVRSPTGTEARVCADITRRQAVGVAKYGVTVENNPLPLRQWLQHAYEETLDQAVYLRRAMDEMQTSPPEASK